jgi:hypothetical protein
MSRELLKLKFQGDFSVASDIILKAVKDKPKNKQIEILSNYLSTSYLYVNALEMQLKEANFRMDKLLESRAEAQELAEEYKKFYLELQSKTI